MKLIFKGEFKNQEQLPLGDLPSSAVAFIEPQNGEELNKEALKTLAPALFGVVLICIFAFWYRGSFPFSFELSPWLFMGIIIPFLLILPHELLHGVCFGKDAQVYLFYSLKNLMAFVTCTKPVSKSRFIWLCLCPNLILGWLPLLLWAILPLPNTASQIVFLSCVIMITFGCGDYLNVKNALRQMPKGSMQQLSGFNSFWFMPENIRDNKNLN